MSTDSPATVQSITLDTQLDRRVALAVVQIGELRVSGLAVWKTRSGKLKVYWPRHWRGMMQSPVVSMPFSVEREIEARVIAAYKQARAEARNNAKEAKQHAG